MRSCSRMNACNKTLIAKLEGARVDMRERLVLPRENARDAGRQACVDVDLDVGAHVVQVVNLAHSGAEVAYRGGEA
eukprot:1690212-Rhodomonas_salina.1